MVSTLCVFEVKFPSVILVRQEIRAAEIRRTTEENNLRRRGMLQAERDFMQITMWNKFVLQLRGKLEGTPWDPEPSHPIEFSEFWKLVEGQQVNFIEYSEFGQDVAGTVFLCSSVAFIFAK